MVDYLKPLNFSNPESEGFLAEFKLLPTEHTLANALVVAADSTDYVRPTIVAKTLVAAEIVAASFGKPSDDFPKDLPSVMGNTSLDGFRIVAIDAVVAVINSVSSRLQGPAQVEEFVAWEKAQESLLERLG